MKNKIKLVLQQKWNTTTFFTNAFYFFKIINEGDKQRKNVSSLRNAATFPSLYHLVISYELCVQNCCPRYNIFIVRHAKYLNVRS